MDRKRRRKLNEVFTKHKITMDEAIQIHAVKGRMSSQDLVKWGDTIRNRIHEIARIVDEYEKESGLLSKARAYQRRAEDSHDKDVEGH